MHQKIVKKYIFNKIDLGHFHNNGQKYKCIVRGICFFTKQGWLHEMYNNKMIKTKYNNNKTTRKQVLLFFWFLQEVKNNSN